MQSNLLSLGVLGTLVAAQSGVVRIGRRFDVLHLAATAYMAMTGIVYNTQMRDIELPQDSTLEWSHEVLHLVAPLWMVLDWFVSRRERDLQWRDLGTIVIFPIAWLGYTLLRAPKTTAEQSTTPYWYPQSDAANYDSGYFGVAGMCLVIAATLLVVAAVHLGFARWRRRARR